MVSVWDRFIRFFHWTLVAGVLICFLTEDDAVLLHVIAGYYIAGLLAARILWGFVGSEHARFSDFFFAPRTVLAYLRDMAGGHARRYLGHSPAGAVMVFALLIMLAAISWTGHVAYQQERGGLTALPVFMSIALADEDEERGEDRDGEEFSEELHEALANILLVLIALHVGGVLLSSYAHRENLVRAMITGQKQAEP